ncbi:PEP-CTERM sorting domain-containing protein [uncultured Paraglaciecola sp.]|uniref:PEP-CTERM sorting domain-containing protein n=1 Tax=uncultured Paraglaciecola sp. TaxID=1765024 RepID=UPI0030DB383E|tara:strand:- start:29265 stop:30041 length:777 start_codon:yes stop_codon:yes gene_type:complete
MRNTKTYCLAILLMSLVMPASATVIDFETFYIRNNNGTIVAPFDADMSIIENAAGDGFSASTPRGGQKVGYGTSALNGFQLNMFNTADWTTSPGATGAHPYLNIWVTDGTNYAIISSENVYMGTDFQTRNEWKIFEYNPGSLDWLLGSGTAGVNSQYLQKDGANVTLADFSDNVVLFGGPGVGAAGVGTGAPQGGFGFNVIFGDTQANFLGQYDIANLSVTVEQSQYTAGNLREVPEPSTLSIFALVLLGLGYRRFKN